MLVELGVISRQEWIKIVFEKQHLILRSWTGRRRPKWYWAEEGCLPKVLRFSIVDINSSVSGNGLIW